MRVILVRHCEPERAASRTAGNSADPPLSETGRRQAERLAQRLAEMPAQRLYSSPMRRALETANAIGAEQRRRVEIEPALDISGAGSAGDQSLEQIQSRAWAFLEGLRDTGDVETAVCVTHEIVVLPIICRTIGLPLDRISQLRQPVGSFSIVEFRGERVQVVTFNENCHLNDVHLE